MSLKETVDAGAPPNGNVVSASLTEGESILAVDIGSSRTRAALFDVVEGAYRFIAAGAAATTAESPTNDVLVGVRAAIGDMQSVTGQMMVDAEGRLITPSRGDGSGVDAFVATISAGPTLRAIVMGLLSDVSMESARRLAQSSYVRILEASSINKPGEVSNQIDALMRLQPDALLVAGGTDGGASRSILRMLEPLGISSYLLAAERRPAVLFAGNERLQDSVKDLLGTFASPLRFTANIRPSLDTEDLGPAQRELASLYMDVRRRQLGGVEELEAWAGAPILPTAYATARVVRFLSSLHEDRVASVLNIDLGVSAAIVGAGFKPRSVLRVYPQFGMGENLPGLLRHTTAREILQWCPLDVSAGVLQDYLFQKALYPSSIPATREDQLLSGAVARQAIQLAIRNARRDFPRSVRSVAPGLLPSFETIIASGGVIVDAPTAAHSFMLLLDAIQPVGITSVVLDPNHLLPLIGAAAERNSMLTVQVLDSGAFMGLGTAVSIVGTAHDGTLVARARLEYEDGTEAQVDVKYGNVEVLPLPTGQTGRLSIQPRHGIDVGFGAGRAGTVAVGGGLMGVVLDARGRPLLLPQESGRRRELLKKWLWTLGI